MTRGEVVALANFQTAFLLSLGNGKAGDLHAVMLHNIGLDFGICGRDFCGDGVQFFGVNLLLDMGVCEFGQTHYRFHMAASGEQIRCHGILQGVSPFL